MKCLNMKIVEVLFFILNFVMIYQMDAKGNKTSQIDANENKTSQMATNINVSSSSVDKDCPQFLKIIHDNNLTDFKISCTPFKINNEINIENVLQQSCLVVRSMLDFICDKKLNMTADLFKRNDSDSICPFDFSHLEHLGFSLTNLTLLNELKTKDHCSRVCSDLYSKKNLCVILSKLSNFLKSFNQSTTPEESNWAKIDSPPIKFEPPKIALEKISKEIIVKQKIVSSGNKSVGTIRNITTLLKDKKKDKNLVMTSVPELEQKSNYKTETSNSYAIFQENNEQMLENENVNEEKAFSHDNQEDLSSLGDSFTAKTEINPNLLKMGSSDVKVDSSFQQKELYSGEGFFSAEDSHFFFYLIVVSSIIVLGYIAFHNKNKILAYALEGTSGRRNRRRPNPARYRKLETNLEEVISSNATNAAASSVVY